MEVRAPTRIWPEPRGGRLVAGVSGLGGEIVNSVGHAAGLRGDASFLCEQLVDRRVGVGDALVFEVFEATHSWGFARKGELGEDEADVVEAELAACVAEPRFAVVPAL